jgi:hypothetical protein
MSGWPDQKFKNQKLIRKGNFLQTSEYYFKMLVLGAPLGFCSLTYSLFSKVFHYKERQCNEYIIELIHKNLIKDTYPGP